jgi:hypothetical protein
MIYYAQDMVSGQIKIGKTYSLQARMKSLRYHLGRPLVLLATEPGGMHDEYQVHCIFNDYHLLPEESILGTNEWFRAGPPLLHYIAQLQAISAFEAKCLENQW